MAQFADWQLGDVFVTARGAKQCALTDGAGKAIRYKSEDVLTVPFGLSAWEEGATRKNLELRCTPAVEDYFEQFNEWARAYLVEHSERIFKKKLTPEQVAESFKGPLHKKGDYPALLRTKATTTGKNAVHFWDEQGNEIKEPKSWQDVEVKAALTIKSLWIQSPASFGFTLECTDLQMIVMPCRACPFTAPARLIVGR